MRGGSVVLMITCGGGSGLVDAKGGGVGVSWLLGAQGQRHGRCEKVEGATISWHLNAQGMSLWSMRDAVVKLEVQGSRP
jgi:hypothetical protein